MSEPSNPTTSDSDAIRAALLAILDAIDYTTGACGLAEPVGAVLPVELIRNARKALGPKVEK